MSPATVVPFSSSFTTTTVLSATEKDRVIEWYRGEFAAANAIIDSLCHHLVQITTVNCGDNDDYRVRAEYECVFAAIHRRRVNWIPVLQTQKYFTIADVSLQLSRAAEAVGSLCGGGGGGVEEVESGDCEKVKCIGDVSEDGDESPESDITDTGSHEHEAQATMMDHSAEVNVVKGLKLFEDAFTVSELYKLRDFVDELRVAGQNGELLGETYILFNKHDKTNKREQIQLGVPLFKHLQDEATNEPQRANNEPIPEIIQSLIDHLVQWHVLSENRKPNGCIINYFDEGEHSQPFLRPPHLDQPLCTLVLSDSTMAFGRTLVDDSEGNFKGKLMLSLKEGSIIVMRNNSADMARHVMCASPTRRVNITFTRVRSNHLQVQDSTPLSPVSQVMTLWQPAGMPDLQTIPNKAPVELIPKWSVIRAPLVMIAPVRPVVVNPRKMPRGGTGVFFPWTVGSRKPAKHLPPRAQKRRLLALNHNEGHISDTMSDPGVEGRIM
ncbi:hypothetical protein KSS87_008757 [Heliosperma pusillum]|nr:hypothetical protein KSS87_008757 [Heliosperma pusillum]